MAPESGPPVLVVGGHRSGTSIVTRALAELGLFTGVRLDENHESTFFQRINRRLTAEAGGHWTTPRLVLDQIVALDDVAAFAAPLRAHVDGPGAREYWGRGRAGAARWGWKDPRNTYLIGLWAGLWPELDVVWVRRNPVDCAASLLARSRRIRSGIEAVASSRRARDVAWRERALLQGHPLLADGWRSLDADSALDIALAYVEIGEETIRRGPHRFTVVDYEELLADPRRALAGCGEFLRLASSGAALDRAVDLVQRPTSRAAVRPGPEAAARLAALGWPVDRD